MSRVTPALQARDRFLADLAKPRLARAIALQVSEDDEVEAGVAWLTYAAQVAPVYYVTEGISALLHGASEKLTIRRGIAFEKEDFFTRYGFAYYERPLSLPNLPSVEQEMPGETCWMRAYLWGPIVGGATMHVVLVEYRNGRSALPLTPRYRFRIAYGKIIDPLDNDVLDMPETLTPAEQDEEHLVAALNIDTSIRSLYTFLYFVRQRLLFTSHATDRADRRRYERVGLPVPDARIVVLRRAAYVGHYAHGESETEWSHRWLVSGHWRNQWYPSLSLHRAIWIDTYVKGPDDKPFIPRERALAVVR